MDELQNKMDLFPVPAVASGIDPITEMVQRNIRLIKENDLEFRRIFGIPLHHYMKPFLGFDVIAFDEGFIKSEDGVSCSQAIERDYGSEAVALVKKLIGIKEGEKDGA